jgi:hypothetical protein
MPDRLKDRLASHRGPAVYPAKAAVPLHGSNRTRIEFVVEKVAAVAVQAGYGLSTSKGSGWRAGSTSARGSKDSHRHFDAGLQGDRECTRWVARPLPTW